MTAEELRGIGSQIARDIAAGLMAATAAGAKQFCTEMEDAARASEADSLSALSDRIDAEKLALTHQIETATGLKRLALQQRLARLDEAEKRMCDEVLAQQPLLLPEPKRDAEPVPYRREGRRFVKELAANGA